MRVLGWKQTPTGSWKSDNFGDWKNGKTFYLWAVSWDNGWCLSVFLSATDDMVDAELFPHGHGPSDEDWNREVWDWACRVMDWSDEKEDA
jgi:hypothetical protein